MDENKENNRNEDIVGENPDGNNEVNMPQGTTEAEDNDSETSETSEETVYEEEGSEISPELSEIMEKYAAYSDKDKKEQDILPEEDDISDEDAGETESAKPQQPLRRKRRKKGGGRLIFGLIMTAIIVAAAIFLAAVALRFARDMVGVGKPSIEIVVEIPMNSGTSEIADILEEEGIIDSKYFFRFFSRVKGADGTYVAGSHVLSPDMSYENIVYELQQGAVDTRESVDVVFYEGTTLINAAQKLEENGVCGAEEFLREFNTGSFGFDFEKLVKISSMKFYKMEGYLFPDTYTFYVNEEPKIVVKKLYRNFETKITPDIYGRMSDLDMELEEVLTLASIVQAEASSVYDMKRVASVFHNRLNNPDEYPLLQSDPTRKYVEDVIKPNIDIPSSAMFEAYNTYEGAGLPPGPICNPGLDAINAVLYPADTDYYFFCANVDTGEVYYAMTNDEHEANLVLAGIK